MTDFVKYVIEGVPLGCVFALVAIGLVLTYKTSGVFNLAFGAQAYVAAVLFYELRVRNEWSTIAAFVVVVLIASPLMGLLLEVLIFRHLRTAPPLAKLVSSLGILVAVPQFVSILLGTEPTFGVKGIWWNDDALYKFGDYVLDGKEMAVIVSTVAAVVLLGVLFRYAPIGLRMRAVVESPRMTELAGVDADRVSAFSWMLSSLFAGLAGRAARAAVRVARGRRTSRRCSSPRSPRPRSRGSPASRSRCSAGSCSASPRRCSRATCRPRACSRRTCGRRCRSPCCSCCCSSGPGCAPRPRARTR